MVKTRGVGRKGYLFAALAVVAVAVGAVVVASRTNPSSLGGADASGDGSTAPALDAKGWINSTPLTPDDLTGKVVVYDFWTYSCVNCVRTIPYLSAWHDRYKSDGLVIIGVHSPEFDFEKDHANVAKAVTKLGVDYPVALDDDMTIWNAFANQYWPADYIYDRSGKQVSVHFGEGGYTETENLLRKLLGVASDSARAKVGAAEGGAAGPNNTPETYNGSLNGSERFASPQPLVDGTATFTAPATLSGGQHALDGAWKVQPEYVESAAAGSAIVLRYTAGQVNLVMSTATGAPIDVTVQVDDRSPVTVTVKDPDLYPLVDDASSGTHTLRLTATAPGVRAFAFTFGG